MRPTASLITKWLRIAPKVTDLILRKDQNHGGLCIPCHARNEKGMLLLMMMIMRMIMKNFIPQESFSPKAGFLSEGQVYSRVSQEWLPKSKGAYNQQLPLKPYTFILHYLSPKLNPSFLLQGKGLQHPLDHRESLQGHIATCTSGHRISISYHAHDCKPVDGGHLRINMTPDLRHEGQCYCLCSDHSHHKPEL